MAVGDQELAALRGDPDPLRRGRRASELLGEYQRWAAEVAEVRRAAIEQAHVERGMTYTEIAAALGLSKGRITQIRTDPATGPPAGG